MSFTLATLRLGKSSVNDIVKLNAVPGGQQAPPIVVDVECTQVPGDLKKGYYVILWLGSDNSKGQATEWKQGFKAIGEVLSVNHHGGFADTCETQVSIGYIFPNAINRLDILREAPSAYYWASSLPIIGLDDHSNQTIRIIDTNAERSDIKALFFALNSVQQEFESVISMIYPDFLEFFGYIPPSPRGKFSLNARPEFQSSLVGTNKIYFGAPGTGKSHKLQEDSTDFPIANIERVTFYPTYSFTQFVGTYKPIMNGAEIEYSYVPGPFIRMWMKAVKNHGQRFLLIIEELNRANAPAVFGDIFQLMDRLPDGTSEYAIAISEDLKRYFADNGIEQETLSLPPNLYIWATMNSADQGVFPLDTAFKRRWDFEYMEINSHEEAISHFTVKLGSDGKRYSWNDLRRAINKKLIDCKVNEDKLLGPFFIKPSVCASADEVFAATFKAKVIMYLFEDAARQVRSKIFPIENATTYSEICKAFDEKGAAIFGIDLKPIDEQTEENILQEQ